MDYQQTLDYLFTAAPMFQSVGAGAYKEGLSTTLALDAHFGHPHRWLSRRTLHLSAFGGLSRTHPSEWGVYS